MRDLLLQFLKTNDVNQLALFLRSWIPHKMPNKSQSEIDTFIRTYLEHLIHVPSMFDPRYQNALTQLLDYAKVELQINSVTRDNKIIKYY